MKTLCIVESAEQFHALRKSSEIRKEDFLLFSTSEEVCALLNHEGLSAEVLSEDLFVSDWDAINTWAKKASLTWFQEFPFTRDLVINGIPIGEAYHWRVGYALVHQLKVQLLVDYLLSTAFFDQAVIFDTYQRRLVDSTLDKQSLNYVLRIRLEERKIPFKTIRRRLSTHSTSALKEFIRTMLTLLAARLSLRKRNFRMFGMGSIKDLFTLLNRLQSDGPVAFIDESLQFATYKICAKNGIPYVLGDSLIPLADQIKLYYKLFQLRKRLKKIRPLIQESEHLHYKGESIVGLDDVLIEVLNRHVLKRFKLPLICQKMFQERGAQVLILHEDRDHFRTAALAAKDLKKRVVVLSHGIPPVNYDWRGAVPNIGIGETIVNSTFEKDKYLQMGYSPELLHVLGLPRFDQIYERVHNKLNHSSQTPMILYCPHRLTSFNQKKGYYLGIQTAGEVTKQNSIEVIKASKEAGCHLLIKLHDGSDFHLWKALMDEVGNPPHAKLVPHHTDIFDLLERCDLLITTFSTVVIEALLFQKNVICLNFTGRADLHPYAEYGIALGVKRSEALPQAVCGCLHDPNARAKLRESQNFYFEYFGGHFDGQNTNRVAQFLLDPNKVSFIENKLVKA